MVKVLGHLGYHRTDRCRATGRGGNERLEEGEGKGTGPQAGVEGELGAVVPLAPHPHAVVVDGRAGTGTLRRWTETRGEEDVVSWCGVCVVWSGGCRGPPPILMLLPPCT